MKKIFLISLFLMLLMKASNTYAQYTPTSTQNYIYTRIILKDGVKTEADLVALPADSVRAEVQYFDGLGRPLQTVAVRNSPAKKDIITPIVYDAFGRQDKSYLPYEHNNNTGAYQPTAVSTQASFYSNATGSIPRITINPFAQTIFEASPLNRILETAPSGESWKVGSGHTIKMGYEINIANEVRLWNITYSGNFSTGATSPGYYGAGQLFKNISWDEHRNRVIEYKDKEGQVVCKKVQDGGDTTNPTYMTTQYLYDDFNQLAYVIPPALETITSFTEKDQNFLNYIYAYHYDYRRRPIEKKIPGKGWEYTVYNKGDRPVLTQDSLQRARGVWSFVKYDTLGRPVMTGEIASTSSRASLETLAGSQTKLYEIRDNTKATGYTNTALPTTLTKIFSISFYDDYSFLQSTISPNPIPALLTQPNGTTESTRTKSLPTLTVTNVLDSAKYLYTATYYDEKARVGKVVKQHLLSGADVVTNTMNFVGEVTNTTRKHYNNNNTTTPALTISTTSQYDHTGRIIRAIEKINSQAPDTISYTYNQLGQLATKKVGNQTSSLYYNARGWIKRQTAPLFTMDLKYDSATVGYQQYNGNIGQQLWKSGVGTQTQRTYSYLYDRANRITSGASDEGYNEQGISYDKMGNIKTLTRPRNSATAITYNYGTRGNQLQSVSGGYARGYTYNGNGSVATTTGTDPLTITYNVLNLPKQVTGSASVTYVYDAAGNKLKKATATETRWYIDGIEYITNSTTPSPAIDLLHTAEGIARRSGTMYNYEYFLKDHLGNTRVVVNEAGTVLQQTDYYPFGMSIGRVANTPNNYLYNGKEQQQELGGTSGGQYDYGARFYDPVIGRFHTQDKFSEKYYSLAQYQYAANNPINNIDVNGDSIWVVVNVTITNSDGTTSIQKDKYYYDNGKDGLGFYDEKGNYLLDPKKVDSYLHDVGEALGILHISKTGAEIIDYLMASTNNTEIARGKNSEGVGSGIGGNFVLWDPLNSGNSPNENGNNSRPSYIGLGHELAHKEDRWKGTMNTGIWYSAPSANGGTANVTNAEIYATHRENQIRSQFGGPLRTHYSPDVSGGVYEPSRIIKAGTAQSVYYDNTGKTIYTPLGKKSSPYKYR